MLFKYLIYKGRKLLISVAIGAGLGNVIGLILVRLPVIASLIVAGTILLILIGLIIWQTVELFRLDYQNFKDKNNI